MTKANEVFVLHEKTDGKKVTLKFKLRRKMGPDIHGRVWDFVLRDTPVSKKDLEHKASEDFTLKPGDETTWKVDYTLHEAAGHHTLILVCAEGARAGGGNDLPPEISQASVTVKA